MQKKEKKQLFDYLQGSVSLPEAWAGLFKTMAYRATFEDIDTHVRYASVLTRCQTMWFSSTRYFVSPCLQGWRLRGSALISLARTGKRKNNESQNGGYKFGLEGLIEKLDALQNWRVTEWAPSHNMAPSSDPDAQDSPVPPRPRRSPGLGSSATTWLPPHAHLHRTGRTCADSTRPRKTALNSEIPLSRECRVLPGQTGMQETNADRATEKRPESCRSERSSNSLWSQRTQASGQWII